MYRVRALDLRSAFTLRIPNPQLLLVSNSPIPIQIVLSIFLALSLFLLVSRILRALLLKSPEEDTALVTSGHLAAKDLPETTDSPATAPRPLSAANITPLSPLPSSPASSPSHATSTFLSAIRAMIASPLVARPVPVPVPEPPPPTLTDRASALDIIPKLEKPESPWPIKQPFDAFLVLDVEATCREGTDFNWPNEIIEWPVVLLRWRNKDKEGRAKELYVADEFRSFVRPIWRPQLTAFCTTLTGITQTQVDRAPKFPKVLESFREFLVRNGLINGETEEKKERFVWCTDGPFDIRDFVVKQCFISKIQMPTWLKGDVLDVRRVVTYCLSLQVGERETTKERPAEPKAPVSKANGGGRDARAPRRRTLNIEEQLRALNLAEFIGRQHCGIDDTRNIARILTELAKRGIRLEPNTTIYPGRRWQWMGKPGQILEEYCFI